MKRGAAEEKTEQWWKHWRENKVTPAAVMWGEKKKKRTRFCLEPTVMFLTPVRIADWKTKRARSWWVLFVTQNKEDADGGNDVERREQRRERRQIKFPRGNTAGAGRRTEKNGRGAARQGMLPAQKSSNPLSYTHIHILDSVLAPACRYDATVIHDSYTCITSANDSLYTPLPLICVCAFFYFFSAEEMKGLTWLPHLFKQPLTEDTHTHTQNACTI